MPDVDITIYEEMDGAALERARTDMTNKLKLIPMDDWSDEDLSTMAAITGVLRRRVSGPPKAVKTPGVKKTKAKATLEDLA